MDLEEVAEFHQLLRIAGQAGELGKHERLDVSALHIFHHALGFGVIDDAATADTGEIVDFHDLPASGVRIHLSPDAVVLGTVSLSLFFAGNTNPNAYALAVAFAKWQSLGHMLPLASSG